MSHDIDSGSSPNLQDRLDEELWQRKDVGTLRALPCDLRLDQTSILYEKKKKMIDFCSNDYLGLARSTRQWSIVDEMYREHMKHSHADVIVEDDYVENGSQRNYYLKEPLLGATGSRLLSGDTVLAHEIEAYLARLHNRESSLLFNSGYDANMAILSCLPNLKTDFVVMDELCHNSLQMGVRMARGYTQQSTKSHIGGIFKFRHNSIESLKEVIENCQRRCNKSSHIFIVVESVYSMEGDVAPLTDILSLASTMKNLNVIVDEAHGLGVYGGSNPSDMFLNEENGDTRSIDCQKQKYKYGGMGVIAALGLEQHPSLLCSIHTFGKAAGCHGAVVCMKQHVKTYFVNYARPFIYSTSLDPHSLICIQASYQYFISEKGNCDRFKLFHLVRRFRGLYIARMRQHASRFKCKYNLFPSPSPIQSVLIPGNEKCKGISKELNKLGFGVYPIRAPTVPARKERIRIIIHVYNTEEDILNLVTHLVSILTIEGSKLYRSKL